MSFSFEAYIEDNLSRVRRGPGPERIAVCPFCGKDGHFYVRVDTGDFVCFKCNERGRGLVGVVAELEGLTREAARAWVWKRQLEDVWERKEPMCSLLERVQALRESTPSSDPSEVSAELPEGFVPVWDGKKWRVPRYLTERGISRETARHFQMGFSERGRFRGRVILPIVCPNGRSFTARAVDSKRQPRYLNPRDMDHGRLLFGWPEVLSSSGPIVIVEGPFDAVRMYQHGKPALALLGKVLHRDQFLLLLTLERARPVIVMLDPEERIAPLEVARQLRPHFSSVKLARLPLGSDPGSAPAPVSRSALRDSVPYTGDRLSVLKERLKTLG